MKVLIVKLSAIGDVIHTIPFLNTLRLNFPEWEIHWALEDVTYPLLKENPYLNRSIVIKRKSWVKGRDLRGLLGTFKGIRETRYDMVIDLQGLLKSGILTGLAKAREKIGLNIAREFSWLFYSRRIDVDIEKHALLRTLDVARKLGAKVISEDAKVYLSKEERLQYSFRFEKLGLLPKRYIVINPVAKWPTKLWLKDRFAALADWINKELGYVIVFTGSKTDQEYIRGILTYTKERHIDLSGTTTLRELAFLLEQAKAMVCTDTGPMHIGAAMGCPVVALFGPTSPNRTGPYGKGHKVIRAGVYCSPCFKKGCSDTICMSYISLGKVKEGVMDVIK